MNGIQEAIQIVDELISDHTSIEEAPATFTRFNLQDTAISTINLILSKLDDELEKLRRTDSYYYTSSGLEQGIRSVNRLLDEIRSLAPSDVVIVPSACEDCNHCVRMLCINSEGTLSIENVCRSREGWLPLPEGFTPETYGSDCEQYNDELPF